MRVLLSGCLCLSLALGTSGCFVLEELDAGMEIMEEHSNVDAKKKRAKQQAAKKGKHGKKGKGKGKKKDPTLVERVQAWLGLAEEEPGKKAVEPDSPPPDPENVLVRCQLDGSLTFLRKFDCQLRGGKVASEVETSPKPKS